MKKSKTKLRALAALLSLCMVLSMVAMGSAAADATTQLPLERVNRTVGAAAVALPETQTAEDIPQQGEVRVLIFMEDKSLVDAGFPTMGLAQNSSAMTRSEKLLQKQETTISRIENKVFGGEDMEIHHQFTIGINAISATVPAESIQSIAQVKGVVAVQTAQYYEAPVTVPNTATSGEMVYSYSAWADGYTGAGSIVAIVDTGIDRDHDSFSEEGFYYGLATSAAAQGKTVADYDLLTTEEIEQILPRLHAYTLAEEAGTMLTAETLYTNDKIPFGFNYLTGGVEYGCDALSGDHGCHVAGIAAANTYVPTADADGDEYFARQTQNVTGIAPNAQLLVMKVFSDGWGAYEDDYMAAIEDAIMLGAASVNLSLGSTSAGRTYSTSQVYVDILAALAESDTVMTNSGGNNGSWADSEVHGIGLNRTEDVRTNTGGSPGSYHQSFTVASVDNIAITGMVGNYNGHIAAVTDTGSNYGIDLFPALDTSEDGTGTEYPYVFLGDPTTGQGIYGHPEDFTDLDLTGKIALVSRGDGVSFFEKANRAVEAGAAATVIYNNADGSINMALDGYLYTNPAVSMAKADSDAILAVSEQDETTGLWGGTVVITSVAQTVYGDRENYTMSSFSSWGCGDDLGLKPEITSPGGNIYSTLDGNTYGLNSGTSMAAPGIAGAVAVVMQYIRENDLVEKTGLSARELAMALLMSSSQPAIDKDTALPYSPRQQGSGLANVYEAVTTPAYLLVGEKTNNDGKVKLELGDDPQRTGVYSGNFSVNNFSDEDLTYSFNGTIFTNAVETINGTDYMAKSGRSLDAQVEFLVDAEQTWVYDLSGDQTVNELDALALLKVANGTAPALEEQVADLYDFDHDGVITTTDAQLLLAATAGDTSVLDASARTYLIPAGSSARVEFIITLSQADKDYFATYYPNGGYIDGFLYAESENGDEKQLSVPLLAFYGNWSDSSMFEHWTLLEDAGNPQASSYMSLSPAMNYLTVRYRGSTTEVTQYANNWASEAQYLPERNAINNRSTLYRVVPTLLRNAANLTVFIRNAETGEEYFTKSLGTGTGAYYNSSSATWAGLGSGYTVDWNITDAEGERLPEGTQIEVVLRAVTEYNWDRENATVVGELGEGAYWVTPMVVDNTAPEATSILASTDSVTGERKITVTALDNRYTAAILLISEDGTTVLSRAAADQTEAGVPATAEFDLEGIYATKFMIGIFDYAGNSAMYDVDMGGEIPIPDTDTILSVALPDNSGQWFADLDVDAQTITTKNTAAGEIPLLSVTRDRNGQLYAASQEVVDNYLVSSLYTVDEEDWSLTKIGGPFELGYTDMSWAPTVNGGSMMAVYGNYALVVDTTTGNYLGVWDLTSFLGSSTYAVALTFVQTTATAETGVIDVFFLLDSKGNLYQTAFSYDTSTQKYTIYTPTLLTTIPDMYSDTFYGSSMYCEMGVLYISALSQKNSTIYSQLFSVDLRAESIWLFDRGALSAAPVCIYDAAPKTPAEGGQALNVLQTLGQPVVCESGDMVEPCVFIPIQQ